MPQMPLVALNGYQDQYHDARFNPALSTSPFASPNPALNYCMNGQSPACVEYYNQGYCPNNSQQHYVSYGLATQDRSRKPKPLQRTPTRSKL